MKKTKNLSVGLLCMSMLMLFLATSAIADTVTIKPSTTIQWTNEDFSSYPFSDSKWKNPDAEVVSWVTGDSVAELYRQGHWENGSYPTATGSYASSYNTTMPTSNETATISYVNGKPAINTSYPTYLLVKDGAANSPVWFIYDLLNLHDVYVNGTVVADYAWNGTDTIYVDNPWPNQGSISHVAFFGTVSSVPEPTTLMLLGFGLVGLAGAGKKFKK